MEKPKVWKYLPNALSFLRIALIIPVVVLYCIGTDLCFILSLVFLVLSMITDFFDGRIARKYNLVSNFGKGLDGIADKILQLGMMLCIVIRYFQIGKGTPVLILFIALMIKEFFMGLAGLIYLIRTKLVTAAKPFGKWASFFIDLTIIALFILRGNADEWVIWAICGFGMFAVLWAGIGYFVMYIKKFNALEHGEPDPDIAEEKNLNKK